jgi:succinate dehydrogenase/fumarate reductase cytochrome b subunit
MIKYLADAVSDQIKSGVDQAAGGTANVKSSADLATKIADIVNLLTAVIGIAAVIAIIYAGSRLVASGGNPEGVKTAKNTIIYAIVGLVLVALAQAIVHFVINGVSQ